MRKLPEDQKKKVVTQLRAAQGEAELIKLAARKAGLPLSEFVRVTVMQSIRHRRGM